MPENIRPLLAGTLLAFCLSPVFAQGVAGFHTECKACHTAEPPAADNANFDACVGCHGEKPGSKTITVNGKTLNPHAGHFDVYDCMQCHKPHAESVNGCAECHKIDGVTMPSK